MESTRSVTALSIPMVEGVSTKPVDWHGKGAESWGYGVDLDLGSYMGLGSDAGEGYALSPGSGLRSGLRFGSGSDSSSDFGNAMGLDDLFR